MSPAIIATALVLNVMAFIISSREYTAWSIRVRNEMYYFLFKKEVNRRKAEQADELAERHARWIRPLAFVIANIALVILIIVKGVN